MNRMVAGTLGATAPTHSRSRFDSVHTELAAEPRPRPSRKARLNNSEGSRAHKCGRSTKQQANGRCVRYPRGAAPGLWPTHAAHEIVEASEMLVATSWITSSNHNGLRSRLANAAQACA